MQRQRCTPQRPLRHHLRRLIGLCLFVPAVVIGVLTAQVIVMLMRERQAQADDLSNRVANRLDAALQAQIRSVQALIVSAPRPGDLHFEQQWHARLVAYDQRFNAPTFLASSSQQILVHSRQALGQVLPKVPVPAGRSAFNEAIESLQPAIGDWVMGPVMKQPVVAIAVPVTDALPEQLVIMSVIPVTYLEVQLQTLSTPPGLRVRLLDSTQKVLAQSHPAAPTESAQKWQPTLTARSLGEVPWTVQVQVHSASYYTPFIALIVFLGAGMMITLWGTLWIARRTAHRINSAMQQIVRPQESPQTASGARAQWIDLRIAEVEVIRNQLEQLRQAELKAKDSERARIAQDLHDGMQHELLAIRLQLDLLLKDSASSPPATAHKLDLCRQQVQLAMAELNRVIHNLRPQRLAAGGLAGAMETLISQWTDVTSLQVEFEQWGDSEQVDQCAEVIEQLVLRFMQECLSNIQKHARASFVHVEVDTREPHVLRVTISDDGIGTNEAAVAVSSGIGLSGLRRRLEAVHGSLTVQSGHDGDDTRGTTVTATVPV